ncbi:MULTISPECIES: serine/threonine-protein kinase [Trichocoleus]|uniref:non-specific serine/threonine protein kinase n=1 Tax=Trichocoleus desertorum GB2-A4 TaxID=2933944 RepID=A0ABV0J5E8_9CYAN|nr:serine/threonine-protein kinase [Trichocoleus sp. FACHB-46]MBD1863836.1 serine/threonine protein kinase [Trichocoleus sp. FACHB-46]
MAPSLADLSNFRANILNQTAPGQVCGSIQLFRDRYKVLRVLGRGGFGVTFLARDVSLPYHPLCVIKQLCPKVNDPVTLDRARKRFEQEAKTLSKLGSHAQIPQLLDYFEADGEFYLVQEYVRGSTLAREIRRYGPQSEVVVKRFLVEMLPLLRYVHSHRVIHRDIKPQNIIRCRDDGRLVLIDFGAVKEQIARLEDTSQRAPTTHFIGTVGFAPPEQLSMRPVFASDIYALGVTCVYLLTGKSPFDFDYDPSTGEIDWQGSAQVSEHFGRVLTKMLHHAPRDRYPSAEALLRALNLEPYLDSLSNCMTVQPHRPEPEHSSTAGAADGYQSPITRTAIAIREWKTKLQNRNLIKQKHLVPVGAVTTPARTQFRHQDT